MKKLFFKSIDTDLQKFVSILETVQKNVLYSTYRIDTILKTLNKIVVDKDLQHQVDEYFEKDPFGSSFIEANKAKDDSEHEG